MTKNNENENITKPQRRSNERLCKFLFIFRAIHNEIGFDFGTCSTASNAGEH
jgi:hypothetical protein